MSFRMLFRLLAACLFLFSAGCTATSTPQATATSTRLPTKTPTKTPLPPTPTVTPTPSPTPLLHPGWARFTSDLNSVSDIAFDHEGSLWVATRNQGLLKWDVSAKSSQRITKADGLPGENATAVAVAPNGTVWAGFGNYVNMSPQSTGLTVAQWDGVRWDSFTAPETFKFNSVDDMTFAPDGTLWILDGDQVRTFDGKDWVSYDSAILEIPDNDTWPNGVRIAAASNGEVWALTSHKGLLRFREGKWSSAMGPDGLVPESLKDFAILPDGTIWVTFDRVKESLWATYDGTEWKYVSTDSFEECYPNVLAAAPDGRVWSTYYDGIIRISGDRCEVFNGQAWTTGRVEENILPFGETNSVMVGPDGAVWFGTETMGLFRFDGKEVEAYPADAPTGTSYGDMEIAPDGTVWVTASQSGILRFDGEHWTLFPPKPGLPLGQISKIFPAVDGSVWFAGPAEMAVQYRGEEWRTIPLPAPGYPASIHEITAAPNGAIWLASSDYFLIPTGSTWSRAVVQQLRYYDGDFASDTHDEHVILSMQAAPDGTIWFGTGVGIARYRYNSYQLYILPGERVDSVAVTQEGQVWFAAAGTNIGPPTGGMDPHQYVARFDEHAEGYAVDKGLIGNSVRSLRLAPDGGLWALTNDGVYRFDGSQWNIWGDGAAGFDDLAFAPDGSIWFLRQGEISRYQP